MRKCENQSKQKFKKSACIDLGNGRSDPFELRERKFRLAYALPIFCQVASWQSEMDVERVMG